MKGKLKDSDGKIYGSIGDSTCHTYEDGSSAKVGDRVKLMNRCSSCGVKYVAETNGETFVMGVKGTIFKLGYGTGYDNNWSIQKITDWSEIKNGDIDGQNIIACIPEHEIGVPDKNNDLLYSFVMKSNIPFENRKYVEQMIDSGVLQICANHFVSAKIINKRTGEVTDLLQ